MAEPIKITLDAFFAHSAPLEIINYVAQIGTERTEREDSVWNGETYGGFLDRRLAIPNGRRAVKSELVRSLEVVGLSGSVSVEQGTEVTTENASIVVSREGVTFGSAS